MKRGLFLTGCLSAMLLATVTLASGSEHAQKFNTHAIESENVTFEQFFEAVISGNKDKVKAYLTLGANVHWVDANQRTALHWAILLGHKKVAKKLIKSGAQVDAQDARGYTPLHYAAESCNDSLAAMLIHYNARPGKSTHEGHKAPYLAHNCNYALQLRLQGKRIADGASDLVDKLRGKGRSK